MNTTLNDNIFVQYPQINEIKTLAFICNHSGPEVVSSKFSDNVFTEKKLILLHWHEKL